MKQNSTSPAGSEVQQSDTVEGEIRQPNLHKTNVSGSVYQIETLEDLCNVANVNNIDNLCVDLLQWLQHYVYVISKLREANAEITKGKKNTEIAKGSFEWHDDGKTDFLGVNVIDEKTGSIEKHRF